MQIFLDLLARLEEAIASIDARFERIENFLFDEGREIDRDDALIRSGTIAATSTPLREPSEFRP